ncbi:WD40 repeat-like protein [Mycena venus]|uniref:WD40 repeat-like protein n=1 Tax=Mycena venus TaxID=2733690 RepID=A0A8H7DBF9_9AGAR|nr:WD40 repeat-like protein [Mycena venus]
MTKLPATCRAHSCPLTSTMAQSGQSYKLVVKSVSGIHWEPGLLHRNTPKLYVAIDIDGVRVNQTNAKRDFVAMWNYVAILSTAKPSSVITLQIYHDNSLLRKDICLARTQITIHDLLDMCGGPGGPETNADVSVEQVEKKSSIVSAATLVVRLTTQTPMQASETRVDNSIKNVAALGTDPSRSHVFELVDRGVQTSDGLSPLGTALGTLLSRLDIIVEFGGELAKIHPFAEAAFRVLTAVYKAARNQLKTDEKIVQLVQTMVDIYSFAKDVESLSKAVESLRTPIAEIVVQTEKCAHFIGEYSRHGFGGRVVNGVMCNNDEEIEGLTSTFLRLQKSIGQALTGHTAFAVTVISDRVQDLVQSDMLKVLDPAKMDASLRRECLPGTRREIIRLITDSLTTPAEDVGNIFWLYGVAGSGKSTIATSVARHFRKLNRLGAFLFFTRGDSASSPSSVIRSIAHQLAQSNTHVAAEICTAITEDRNIVSDPPLIQFQKLLLDPLNRARDHIHGPLVVVLDALDECGDPSSRRSLVSVISNEFHKLPPMLRFFITSRPDQDIAASFDNESRVFKTHLDITTSSSVEDIRLYIEDQLVQVRNLQSNWELDSAWPGMKTADLVNSASGLFIWAATAMKLLGAAYNPNDALDTLLKTGSKLDDLYAAALRSTELWDDSSDSGQRASQHVRAILAAVVLGRVPMSDLTIDRLLELTPQHASRHLFPRLGCVLQWAPGKAVRLLHASFGDYLTDPTRSGGQLWFIDCPSLGWRLASGCLKVLNASLRFNICGLKDSHIPNSNVHDLPNHIATSISPALSYSSRFWADHLHGTALDNAMLENIRLFVSTNFLYWLEVLSVLKETAIATNALTTAARLTEKHDQALAEFLTDAAKFVIAFAPAIAYSAPHIYLSAVPLAPKESKIAKQFSGLFTRKIGVQTSFGDHWPQLQTILEGHTKSVRSVASSIKGYIASGADDNTVRVWDARTGVLITGPLGGHKEPVRTVAFSLDGDRIASASQDTTILVWDAETGEVVAGPLRGHSAEVTCVAFSPSDGERLASSSFDGTVRVWNLRTGTLVAGPFEGHGNTVTSLSFSPDGQRIVTASADSTLRVWDLRTESSVASKWTGYTNTAIALSDRGSAADSRTQPFGSQDNMTHTLILRGHRDSVMSVCFSPDKRWIASGSADTTIRVWDACSGDIALLIQGHTQEINCVVFSPDGKWIASASDDRTVRVWDAETGELVAGPFRGHNDRVNSLAFSPDGERIVSGSADHMVRIWNTRAPQNSIVQQCLPNGHEDAVYLASFCPDGNRIASFSIPDRTLCIWNAQTGSLVDGPHSGAFGKARGLPAVFFSPNGPRLATGVGKTVHVWDVHVQPTVADLLNRHIDTVFSVGFRVLSNTKSMPLESSDHAGAPHIRHNRAVSHLALSANGKMIMSEAATDIPKDTVILHGHTRSVYSLAFSSDGQRIVSGSGDTTIQVWDAYSGARVGSPMEGHSLDVNCVVFSPDGKQIASGSDDETVGMWDVKTGALLGELFRAHGGAVHSVAFSPDGERIISGSSDGRIRVWDTHSKVLALAPLEGHTREVYSVDFSRDGKWIVSGSRDRTVLVWDAQSGSKLHGFEGHSAPVFSVAFFNSRVVSGSMDRTIRVSEIQPPDSIAHQRLGGTWTLKDGWIVNSASQLLLWIPAWLRDGLYYPHTSLVISASGTTKLDFTDFAHGTSWQECFRE